MTDDEEQNENVQKIIEIILFSSILPKCIVYVSPSYFFKSLIIFKATSFIKTPLSLI